MRSWVELRLCRKARDTGMLARFYRYFRWLSLDVTAGAIVLMIFFCQELDVPYHWPEYTILGIVVWLIYTIDHLKDVSKLIAPVSARRKFHVAHFRKLVYAGVVACLAAILLVFLQSERIVLFGSLIGSISGFYLFVSKRIDWFKEFWIAITYAFGILLVPIARVGFVNTTILLVVGLILMALINLLLFSHFEVAEDEEEGFRSFASVMGSTMVNVTLAICFSLLAFVIYGLWMAITSVYIAIFMSTTFLLYLGIWQIRWFRRKERYRIFGDAVLMLPLFFILT